MKRTVKQERETLVDFLFKRNDELSNSLIGYMDKLIESTDVTSSLLSLLGCVASSIRVIGATAEHTDSAATVKVQLDCLYDHIDREYHRIFKEDKAPAEDKESK